MERPPAAIPYPTHRIDRWGARVAVAIERLAVGFALAGGGLLIGLIGMSVVSLVGRKLFNAPIQGDIEIMQMGTAVAAAALLPLCAIRDHHIRVDAVTQWLPSHVRAALDAVAHALLAAVMGLIVWRTALQCVDARAVHEVSTLLSVPVWIPVALMLPSLALLVATALVRVKRSFDTAERAA